MKIPAPQPDRAAILPPRARIGPLASALLAVAFAGCDAATPPEPSPPDVLLVVVDTVRADRSSSYGYARPTTIQLSALAEAGLLFEDVTAPASWTLPSHASLFTGQPPWIHGAHSLSARDVEAAGDAPSELFGMQVSALRTDLPTLAERFTQAGYRSVALVANPWLGPEMGITRGFARVDVFDSDAEVVTAALAALEERDDRPLLLFLNLMSAHAPYLEGPGEWRAQPSEWLDPASAPEWLRPYLLPEPGPEAAADHEGGARIGAGSSDPEMPGARGGGRTDTTRGVQLSNPTRSDPMGALMRHHGGALKIPEDGLRFVGRLYDAGIRGADFSFGRVLERWAGRSPDGVVAVTSDHGEALGEHGLLEHRASVYPEVLRVPLVLAAPGRLEGGKHVTTPVALHELHDALLELAGLAEPGSSELLAIAEGGPRSAAIAAAAWPVADWDAKFGGRYSKLWRLYREADEALIWSDADDVELYRVDRDPEMRANLAPLEPERADALLSRAKAHFDAQPGAATGRIEISNEMRERLKALGYSGAD